MSALFKRVGVAVVVLDLLVAGVAAAALHHSTGTAQSAAGKMSSGQLGQIVESSTGVVNVSCTKDPTAGWDYYCISSDGSRTLYDVSAGQITKRADLPSGN
jgi:hypothetical protein